MEKNKFGIHNLLAHSHSVYFIGFIIGVALDIIFKIRLSNDIFLVYYIGTIMLIVGTVLIIWAQRSGRIFHKIYLSGNFDWTTFKKGPFSVFLNPTHFGVTILFLGFGFLTNAFFVVFFTIVGFLITQFVFIKREERLLEQKYGENYKKYRQSFSVHKLIHK